MPKTVKAKKPCCKSTPRCKRCPVVLDRLDDAGHVQRLDKRTYHVKAKVPKKALKAARRPRGPNAR